MAKKKLSDWARFRLRIQKDILSPKFQTAIARLIAAPQPVPIDDVERVAQQVAGVSLRRFLAAARLLKDSFTVRVRFNAVAFRTITLDHHKDWYKVYLDLQISLRVLLNRTQPHSRRFTRVRDLLQQALRVLDEDDILS